MQDNEKKLRLRTLRIVLVLSFISNGMSLLGGVMLSIPSFRDFFRASISLMPEVLHETYETMLAITPWYYLVSAVFYALALAGAILMWQPRGVGFHYYTLSKLMLIATPLAFLGRQYFNIGDAMMSLLFIAFYFISLRTLGAFDKKKPETTGEATPDNSDNAGETDETDQKEP